MSVELDDLDLFHRPQECSFHSIVNEVRAPRPVDLCHTVLTDTIYGAIALPGPVALLYDTPQVQRLQDLKQLGAANFVFPTATHTRLAHSVGVAYLGMDLLRRLREAVTLNPLTLCVNPWTEDASFIKDLCCVGMAGLCHDLGHGPFSHLFESFINEGVAREKRWSHEENSLAMLRAAWELRKDDLMDMAFDESDLKFVSLLIRGMEESEEWDEELYGRPETCRFMTEIVANKLNGLDVDKIDYIQRDAFYCLNTTPIASVSFLFTGAIIAMVKGRTRICYPSSVADNVEQIFFERASLHRLIYQCRDTLIVNHMVKDALHRANDHVRLSTNPPCNFTTCVQFPDVFLTVSDWVLGGIHRDGSAENATAREIVGRIYRRDFYRTLICYTRRKNAQNLEVGEMEAAIRAADAQLEEELQEWSRTHQLSYLTIVSQVITIGSSDTPAGVDPVSSVAFHDFGALDDNVVKVGRPHALDGSILAHHVDHKTFFIACRPSLPVEKLNVMIGALLSMQGMERAASQSPVSHKRERSTTNVAMSPAPSQPRLDDHHSMEGRRSFSASPSLNVYRGL